MAHGGGKRMEVGSDEYRLIRRWIAAGMPFGEKTDPVVTHISVYPEHRVMTRNNQQQFAVYAHYSDGTVEDITRRAQYESNDQEIAVVDAAGLVRTLGMSGEAAVMVRYQEHVAIFRATVPLGVTIPDYTFPRADRGRSAHRTRNGRNLGLVPSELCSDEQFIRRVSLDLTGTLPTPAQVHGLRRRQGPEQARQAGRSPAGVAGIQLLFRQQMGGHPARQAPQPARPGQRHLRLPRLDPRQHRPRQALRRVRPRHPRRQRRRGDQSADGVVQGAAEPRAVRGRHGPGVPRPAPGLRPVPPPSLREVEPGRLLGHRRLLRPGRPQERAGARRGQQPAGRPAGRLHRARAATSSTSAPARRRS